MPFFALVIVLLWIKRSLELYDLALSKILNAEKLGKDSCLIKPSSKTIKEVLRIMQENMFIGEFKETDDGRGGIIKINLIGKKKEII